MTTIKARIFPVPVGYLSIEGLENEAVEQDFYVAASQVAEQFQFDKNQASRDIKRLLGNGFQFDKIQTSLNPKPVNAISLVMFEKLLFELALKGNQKAIGMSRDLIGLSLKQLFCDAAGRELDKQARQGYLKVRQASKSTRKTLQDEIAEYIDRNKLQGTNQAKWLYSNTTNKLYRLLFGADNKKLQAILSCTFQEKVRDLMSTQDLLDVERIENLAMKLISQKNTDPLKAVEWAFRANLMEQRKVTPLVCKQSA
ncbi:hypothetical protein H6F51_18155 [Cyanobacteria bacterium FACHB-DQ100]|nr:hypothetical protein [Cyanobacteria bacterium FACHB-DQ100]